MSDNPMYGHLDPVHELRTLIREAVQEGQRNTPEPRMYLPKSPRFRKVTPQTYWRDTLAEVLTTSDALYVLYDMIEGGKDE